MVLQLGAQDDPFLTFIGKKKFQSFCLPVRNFCKGTALAAVCTSAILYLMKYHGCYFSVLTIPKYANFTISLAS